jgi:hypothetical protein
MDLNEFMNKYGSNVQTDEAWIFPDKPQLFVNTFQLVGFSEKKSAAGSDIPVVELMDTESKIKMLLSLWSTDKQLFNDGIEIGNTVKLSLTDGKKIHVTKV